MVDFALGSLITLILRARSRSEIWKDMKYRTKSTLLTPTPSTLSAVHMVALKETTRMKRSRCVVMASCPSHQSKKMILQHLLLRSNLPKPTRTGIRSSGCEKATLPRHCQGARQEQETAQQGRTDEEGSPCLARHGSVRPRY